MSCVLLRVPPIRGDPISHSQAHIPRKPLPPALAASASLVAMMALWQAGPERLWKSWPITHLLKSVIIHLEHEEVSTDVLPAAPPPLGLQPPPL